MLPVNPFLLFVLPRRFGDFIGFLVLVIFVGFGVDVDVCTSLLIWVVLCGGDGTQVTGRDCRPVLLDGPFRRCPCLWRWAWVVLAWVVDVVVRLF